MKREHGEEEPVGAKSVTAPATVSGKQPRSEPLDKTSGKVRGSRDPQVRRPAITGAFQASHFNSMQAGRLVRSI